MKNLIDYKVEMAECRFLDDFVLTRKEWNEFELGTKAYRVRTYNDSGKLTGLDYVLKGLDNTDEVLADLKQVACGYYTETMPVIRR